MNSVTSYSCNEIKDDYTKLQQLRYRLAGAKGGDGDPAYARDMNMKIAKKRSEFEETGVFRYAREGD